MQHGAWPLDRERAGVIAVRRELHERVGEGPRHPDAAVEGERFRPARQLTVAAERHLAQALSVATPGAASASARARQAARPGMGGLKPRASGLGATHMIARVMTSGRAKPEIAAHSWRGSLP